MIATKELTLTDRIILLDPILSRLSQEIEDFGERLASIAEDLEHEGTCNPDDAAKTMAALNRGDTYTIEHVVAWHWFRESQSDEFDRHAGHMGQLEGMAA